MADKFFDAMFTASVLGGSSGPAPVIVSKNITENGTYSALDDQADGYNPVVVDVPNSYTAGDEGKVVSGGALVAQTSTSATVNGTINTTTNNEVVVNVPNTYTAGDEGKVVSGGQLVAQTAYPTTITENGTYNTTENNSVTVDISTTKIITFSEGFSNKAYAVLIDNHHLYIFGTFMAATSGYITFTSTDTFGSLAQFSSTSLYIHATLTTNTTTATSRSNTITVNSNSFDVNPPTGASTTRAIISGYMYIP